ncbi:MAG: DUF2226 domain-containing protein [archaeon]
MKGPAQFDVVDIATKLSSTAFNGYLIQSIKGHFLEEGVLFFREGAMFACIVECLKLEKNVKGKEALEYFLNQTKGKGYYQVVELTRSQVDLVTAFDEKILLGTEIPLKDLPKLVPITFVNKFEPEVRGQDLLDSYGLGDLKKNF